MTKKERASRNKKKSILGMIKLGEISLPDALGQTETLHDEGKLLEADYEELSDYINELMDQEEDAQSEENAPYTEEDASMQDTNEQTNDESEE